MHVAGTLINESISVVMNILLFSSLPLVWYLVKQRTIKGFPHWLGLYGLPKMGLLAPILNITAIYLITLAANISVILSGNSGRSPVDTRGLPVATLLLYLLLYGMKIGIAEEIFFRGFVAKRLIETLGFSSGNVLQAVIFALPHFKLIGAASPLDITVRIINAGLLGYVFGLVVHRKCSGSIVLVMIAHILINMASSLILTLLL